jgi:hypothetical protein
MGQSEYHVSGFAKSSTHLKKKTLRSTQAATDRVQKLRVEYWEEVKDIAPENLIFLDEMGVLLGLTRTHGRSPQGDRVYDLKPFYRGAKVTVIGAISLNRVLAVMTLNDSDELLHPGASLLSTLGGSQPDLQSVPRCP